MARNLFLIRHGELAGEYYGRYIGRTDAPLSAEGNRQAESLATVLEKFGEARIICSPLLRARRTAEISLKGRTFSIDCDLREIDFGRWEGMSFPQMRRPIPPQSNAGRLWTMSSPFRTGKKSGPS